MYAIRLNIPREIIVHSDPHFNRTGFCVCSCYDCHGPVHCFCLDCPCDVPDAEHVPDPTDPTDEDI